MNSFRYADSVRVLLERVPEFAEYDVGWSADLPHDAFGTFAQFLCRRINEGATEDLLRRAFGLMDEMIQVGDDDVQNLLVVSVFEVFADDKRCHEVAERHLSEKAAAFLRRTRRGWV